MSQASSSVMQIILTTLWSPVLTTIRGYTGFEFLRLLIGDVIQDDPMSN